MNLKIVLSTISALVSGFVLGCRNGPDFAFDIAFVFIFDRQLTTE